MPSILRTWSPLVVATVDLSLLFPPGKDGKHRALPKQQEFLDYVLDANGPKFVAYYGGYGSGKSLILCAAMIIQCVLHGGEYVIARQFMPELRRTTLKLLLDMLPKELLVEFRVADAEVHIRSVTGKPAVIYFVGLDSPEKLDSLTLSGAAIDEASQVSEEAFLKLFGRLRSTVGLRKLILVGNPKGHDYVYKYFVKQDIFPDTVSKSQYKIVLAPSTENVHLPTGYVESMLASYSKERIQRDIYGSFDSFEGMVFNEFNRQLHIVKPFAIPDSWVKLIGADHGYRNPAAFVWGAIDHDDNIWIYRELYKREWLIEELCGGKKDTGEPGVVTLTGKEKIEGIWIDPSTKRRNGQTGESDFDLYVENLPKKWPLIPANNEVEAGLDRVKSYLKPDTKGKPSLYIFETCHSLIDEIASYRYEELSPSMEHKSNAKESPRKKDDHAVDALRYLLMSRVDAPRHIKDKSQIPWNTPQSQIQKELESFRKPKEADPFSGF